jgi:hypothetical protein
MHLRGWLILNLRRRSMTLSEWSEWRKLPQTSEWFKYLKNLRELAKEDWADAAFVGAEESETLQRNAAALGEVKLLYKLINTEYEDLEEIKDELK